MLGIFIFHFGNEQVSSTRANFSAAIEPFLGDLKIFVDIAKLATDFAGSSINISVHINKKTGASQATAPALKEIQFFTNKIVSAVISKVSVFIIDPQRSSRSDITSRRDFLCLHRIL